ncbi:MAG: hypothetical protein IJU65_11315 [Desulfovibrio sp.]|nr:hypothetical protein [Desulfovibrio sp.]
MPSTNYSNRIPKSILALPDSWQEVYLSFRPHVTYFDMVEEGWFKSNKSASTVLTSDASAPRPQYIGRVASFDREALILWAFNRSRNRAHRGRKPMTTV